MFTNRKIVLLIILLTTLSITAYILIVVIPSRLAERTYAGARKIGEDIKEVFQFTPKVTVNNTIVLQQQSPIFELATLSQTFQHEYEWTNTWMSSTKKILIRGTMEAKAGFDLQKTIEVEINEDHAVVKLPSPELLSLTSLNDMTFQDENGIWNWVNAEDRAAAVNAFTKDAGRYAAEADFIESAKKTMEDKLKEIFKSHGKEVAIIYSDENSVSNPL